MAMIYVRRRFKKDMNNAQTQRRYRGGSFYGYYNETGRIEIIQIKTIPYIFDKKFQ